MYYLQLVLPFQERIQISVNESAKSSPFMQGEPVVPTNNKDNLDEERVVDSTPKPIEPTNQTYAKAGPQHNQWTSKRLSKIIRREAMKAIDMKLSISSQRNSVEAITYRFLVHLFEIDKGEEWQDEKHE